MKQKENECYSHTGRNLEGSSSLITHHVWSHLYNIWSAQELQECKIIFGRLCQRSNEDFDLSILYSVHTLLASTEEFVKMYYSSWVINATAAHEANTDLWSRLTRKNFQVSQTLSSPPALELRSHSGWLTWILCPVYCVCKLARVDIAGIETIPRKRAEGQCQS